jgi:hypothetical protein
MLTASAETPQMMRISREERLGLLKVQLSTGKMVSLEQLRSFARPVMVVGSKAAVEEHMAAAEPFREALLERGVMTVPVVLDGGVLDLPELDEGSTKWRATPVVSPECPARPSLLAGDGPSHGRTWAWLQHAPPEGESDDHGFGWARSS